MSTLDDLFREKLADYSIQPEAGTWRKVEARLSKKNRGIVWMRIAAVLALVCLLATAIRISWKNDPAPLAETAKSPEKKVVETNKTTTPHIADNKNASRTERTVEKKLPVTKDTESETRTDVPVLAQADQLETPVLVTKTATDAGVDQSSKPIVLVYTLGPVEKPVEATALAEKDGSLKKVVEFARNVRHSDASPVGELRTIKEDLFALDFKKKTTSKKQ